MKRIHVMHVINRLEIGGAERVLCALIGQMDPLTTRTSVATLLDGGSLKESVVAQGIEVHSLGMSRRAPNPYALVQLAKHLAHQRPTLVVTWLYHSNLIGGVAARMAGGIPVVWNIRHSTLQSRIPNRMTRLVNWSAARVSHWVPSRTVFVAHAAQQSHALGGYDTQRSSVVVNGFDPSLFRLDPSARASVQHELGLPAGTPLVGLFGRFHVDKGHENFAKAAGLIHRYRPDVHFLLCGQDVTPTNSQLTAWLEREQVASHCHLLGQRSDLPRLTASLDVQVSSSLTEALSNVIGEAMACGVPCAVTNVGDSALLVGDTGRVVPPQDPIALGQACVALLNQPQAAREALGLRCRRQILENFSFDRMVARHFELWGDVCGQQIRRRETTDSSADRMAA
jgi:glycosyltransferase involved in cell wall biosynthesis